MLRLFVGIDLPPELKLSLSLMATGLPGAKWVDPGNYHLTLRFIGEIDEGQAEDVDAALAHIHGPRFDVALATVGHFGMRQLWVGVERNEALQHLHDKIESALSRLGFPPEERRYMPHVSVARLKATNESRLQAYLSEHALYRAPAFRVDHFSLIASYLTKSGAIYEDQADYPLG
ncbi:MAG TPA: RNA 2',3'-cyclic phosphodiesterase [Stellaceae bacterium]|jgi:2'-5' RNA ligase|nr:RNA 2',3'-cyclic phosphodiesterase [Stellaceae bacterium]